LLPGLSIRRSDVVATWAGIRPLTFAADQPMGARARHIGDAASEGAPGLVTLSNGSLGAHRATGKDILAVAARHVRPSRAPAALSRATAPPPDRRNSARLDPAHEATRADVVEAVTREQARTLADVLVRRTGLASSAYRGLAVARPAADAMAPLLGWDATRIAAEVAGYEASMAHLHGLPPAKATPGSL
jgi:glycerol-3-phosphate dehydrogenase